TAWLSTVRSNTTWVSAATHRIPRNRLTNSRRLVEKLRLPMVPSGAKVGEPAMCAPLEHRLEANDAFAVEDDPQSLPRSVALGLGPDLIDRHLEHHVQVIDLGRVIGGETLVPR